MRPRASSSAPRPPAPAGPARPSAAPPLWATPTAPGRDLTARTVQTAKGPVAVEVEGLEILNALSRGALGSVHIVEAPPGAGRACLAGVPPGATAVAFICVEPDPEWFGRAWALHAESLQQAPHRVTFFWPACPFTRLPGAGEGASAN